MSTEVSALGWIVTIVALVGLLSIDLLVVSRRRSAVTTAGAARSILVYVALALLATLVMWMTLSGDTAGQFLAVYVTEYSLSADNLFVFMLIIGRFAVPAGVVEKVLSIGITLSLVLRGAFIAAGSAAVDAFNWVFYIFGAFLVYTAVRLLLSARDSDADEDEDEDEDEKVPGAGLLSRLIPTTDQYDGRRFTTVTAGRRMLTPVLLVVAAIGVANLVFALDSLPAAFGLTHSTYVILTANAFAMLGLRQLYYVVGGLLQRMVYLPYALAAVLGFIGVKLVLEALRGSHIWRIGPVGVPEVGAAASLSVILGVLAIAVVASLIRGRWDRHPGVPSST